MGGNEKNRWRNEKTCRRKAARLCRRDFGYSHARVYNERVGDQKQGWSSKRTNSKKVWLFTLQDRLWRKGVLLEVKNKKSWRSESFGTLITRLGSVLNSARLHNILPQNSGQPQWHSLTGAYTSESYFRYVAKQVLNKKWREGTACISLQSGAKDGTEKEKRSHTWAVKLRNNDRCRK